MWSGEFECVTYCSEPSSGLSRARNTGLRRATCEIVAWTDDDAIVHPSWIHAIRQVFSDSTISGMTGLVMPADSRPRRRFALREISADSIAVIEHSTTTFSFSLRCEKEAFPCGKSAPGPTWRSAVMSSIL